MLQENSKKKKAVIIIAMFALGIIFIVAGSVFGKERNDLDNEKYIKDMECKILLLIKLFLNVKNLYHKLEKNAIHEIKLPETL